MRDNAPPQQFQKRSNDRYANVSFRVPCDCEVLLLNEEGSTIDLGIGHIFGDPRSATTGEADILPCSWAFSVWVQTQQGIYFYGGASGQAAPPETPYHVGEFGDHALTAELLALSWGLIWASEFAPFFSLAWPFTSMRSQSVGASLESGNRLCIRPCRVVHPCFI